MRSKPKYLLRPSRKKRGLGFTLIELIVVLVILGILAAFAIPRFANVNVDAREAALKGLAGSLRSSAALVHGLAMARGLTKDTDTVQLENNTVNLVSSYPAATDKGIEASVVSMDGFLPVTDPAPPAKSIVYTTKNAPSDPAKCNVTYTEASPGGAANVLLTLTDCK